MENSSIVIFVDIIILSRKKLITPSPGGRGLRGGGMYLIVI
jgi:hypothetical protein